MREIFDAKSSFRAEAKTAVNPFTYRSALVEMLASNALLDTSIKYTVTYNLGGLFINNNNIDILTAGKYISFIQSKGFIPREHGDSLIIDNKKNRCTGQTYSHY